MSRSSSLTKYISTRRGLLEPIFTHGLDAVIIAVIVHATSLMLRFILPPDYAAGVEQIELLFYLALSASLCIYTFVVFCLSLTVHLLEGTRQAYQKLSTESEHPLLLPHRNEGEIHEQLNARKKTEIIK